GFTPQYEGLVWLNRCYERQGFTVIGVPTNDFGNQEPGDDAAIRFFCQSSYDVDFPIAAKT
ncbi:MAG: glutathione peroxidase, partial [Gammaproteobacteria bacterium]|nr:glutathione peroxidase [Gammaproteobacteria bacterium]